MSQRYKSARSDSRATACIEAVLRTLREHGFSLEHEDGHGAFILAPVELSSSEEREYNEEWLRGARLDTQGDQGAATLALEARRAREASDRAEFERVANALCGNESNDSNQPQKKKDNGK